MAESRGSMREKRCATGIDDQLLINGHARRMTKSTEKVGAALTSLIKLEDKVNRQAEAMKAQQAHIEDLTGRVIRLEAQLELLITTAIVKKLKE